MDTFLAVIKDLGVFAYTQIVGVRPSRTHEVQKRILMVLPTAVSPVLPSEPRDVPPLQFPLHSAGANAYVHAAEAAVFYRPVLTIDGVIARYPYATRLTVLGFEGRFARVVVNDTTGFVLKEDITEDTQEIFPVFHSEEIYSHNHPDTKKVRTLLQDEFFTTPFYLPLQAVEFALYQLRLAGRNIHWPTERPRIAGRWQTLLKGKAGIQISVRPKTGAIIEFTKPDGTGFVGYTKAVHVDETIVLEGVGRLIEGEYREEIVHKEVWHEWRPVWISVT